MMTDDGKNYFYFSKYGTNEAQLGYDKLFAYVRNMNRFIIYFVQDWRATCDARSSRF